MIQKKIFKWVGGKKWIKDSLNEIIIKQINFNPNINTYIEPCAGGLGSFLSVAETLLKANVKKIYLNDLNEVLISTFENLQKNNVSLFNEYIRIEKMYEYKVPVEFRSGKNKFTKQETKEALSDARDFFLEMRTEYNLIKHENSIKRSALFIFLMQHVFNGMYRENKSGFLNTPYNWSANVASSFVMKNIFSQYKKMFSNFNIVFSSKSLFEFLIDMNDTIDIKNTICYIDPPFMNEKNNELSYTSLRFTKKDQIDLLSSLTSINFKHIIYSNHDFPIFHFFAEQNELTVKVKYRNSLINPLKPLSVPELLIYREFD